MKPKGLNPKFLKDFKADNNRAVYSFTELRRCTTEESGFRAAVEQESTSFEPVGFRRVSSPKGKEKTDKS